jgi:CubicO group peptidase (beta-lactamase class C family)
MTPTRFLRSLAALALAGLLYRPAEARACQAGAASRPVADVSALLEVIVEKSKVPGLAAAIVDGERLLALGAAGERARGSGVKVTARDKFHLGSCTKAMTATLAATLVKDGRCKWGTTVGDAFPELAGSMDAAWKGATLEQLLTNSSGAPHDLNRSGLWGELWNFDGAPLDARLALVKGVLRNAPESKPGTKFLYSNAGFSIAGAMAERFAKEPYEALMRERLFTPLGMASAGFDLPGTAAAIDQPRGHSRGAPLAPGKKVDNPDAIAPAGKVHASLEDWGKFVSLHLRGDAAAAASRPAAGALGLDAAAFVKMHTPVLDQYAMGWAVAERPWAGANGKPGRVLTHNGSNTQWFCVAWLAPERGFAVVAACNEGGSGGAGACDAAAAALIGFHGKDPRNGK